MNTLHIKDRKIYVNGTRIEQVVAFQTEYNNDRITAALEFDVPIGNFEVEVTASSATEKKNDTNYEEIRITLKNGNEEVFSAGEWDDYRYLGNAVAVIKDKIWIAIYNFDEVYSVKLK